jgi:hypothetical protein
VRVYGFVRAGASARVCVMPVRGWLLWCVVRLPDASVGCVCD